MKEHIENLQKSYELSSQQVDDAVITHWRSPLYLKKIKCPMF